VTPRQVIDAVTAAEGGYRSLAAEFVRRPRRRVVLVAALAGSADRAAAEKWLRHFRFGREYGEPVLALASRGPATLRALKDRRKMRDSRLFTILEPLPDETVLVLWALGNELARQRVERYVGELSRIRPEVGGRDLIGLGYEPSEAFSSILSRALMDRLDGRAVGREAELANLKRLAKAAKLDPRS